MANVIVPWKVRAQIDELPMPIQARLDGIIVRLRRWPEVSGAKPLRGDLAGRYRIRTGDYRIQFHVAGDVVTIEKAGHRDGFYGD